MSLDPHWKLLSIDFESVLSGSSNAHEDCPLCVEESYIGYRRRFTPRVDQCDRRRVTDFARFRR